MPAIMPIISAILIALSVIIIIAVIYIFLTLPRVFDPANMDYLLIDYAHRGLHDKESPENSLSAFAKAVEENHGIELDVQLSSDGEIFVFHDDSLKRMCGVDKKIHELTAEEIKSYRLLDTNESIPTLDEVFKLVDARVPILIEIKYYARTTELCAALASALDKYYGIFAVQSFDPRALRYFKKNRPRFARGQLVGKPLPRSQRKGEKNENPIVSFLLTHLLLNFISRPDFISIQNNHARELGFVLATEIFKAKGFIWTVRSNKQFNFFKRQGYINIFENFKPE